MTAECAEVISSVVSNLLAYGLVVSNTKSKVNLGRAATIHKLYLLELRITNRGCLCFREQKRVTFVVLLGSQ